MTDETERRQSQQELIQEIRAYQSSVDELSQRVDALEEMLRPVADFYGHVQSDLDTLGRLGRGLRSAVAWAAAILISVGVIMAWVKNGFKFPGG